MNTDLHVRTGDTSDTTAVLALLDQAHRWLLANGRTGQWGTEPLVAQPREAQRVDGWATSGGLRIAELHGIPVGAIALGDAPRYAPPVTEPELYVLGFVTDREHQGRGIGTALLAEARAEAAHRGAELLRLDCWAGGDRALVRYYERVGFTATERFTVEEWEGQVLVQRNKAL